jgi:hypothetical protein
MNQKPIGLRDMSLAKVATETCSAREIMYKRSMVEANDDISSTEPTLP